MIARQHQRILKRLLLAQPVQLESLPVADLAILGLPLLVLGLQLGLGLAHVAPHLHLRRILALSHPRPSTLALSCVCCCRRTLAQHRLCPKRQHLVPDTRHQTVVVRNDLRHAKARRFRSRHFARCQHARRMPRGCTVIDHADQITRERVEHLDRAIARADKDVQRRKLERANGCMVRFPSNRRQQLPLAPEARRAWPCHSSCVVSSISTPVLSQSNRKSEPALVPTQTYFRSAYCPDPAYVSNGFGPSTSVGATLVSDGTAISGRAADSTGEA